MAIYDFFLSRNNAVPTPANYVGHKDRLFYDSATGVIKLSDGVTPGGVFIPYNIATTTTIGGIKAGPGANVSVDGTLTIDTTGLPLSFGDFVANVNILSMASVDQDMVLATSGSAEVQLIGNIGFYRPNGLPPQEDHRYFRATDDGQITILVPVTDPLAGAVKIVGSASRQASPPVNTGVMLHVTGNNNDPSRIYNDGVNAFAAFVGRRINGTVASPTAILAGDEIIRISSTGHNGTTVPGSGSARIVYQAIENYTPTATGSNISLWTTAVGSNVLAKVATVDSASGITTTKATIQGNLTVGLNTTVTGNVTATTYRGNSRNAGTLGAGGTLTIDYATDHHVFVNITGAITIAHTNITAGRNVKVIIVNATGNNLAVNAGVPDINSTGNNAGANLNANRMGVYEFISFGTATTTLYVSINK